MDVRLIAPDGGVRVRCVGLRILRVEVDRRTRNVAEVGTVLLEGPREHSLIRLAQGVDVEGGIELDTRAFGYRVRKRACPVALSRGQHRAAGFDVRAIEHERVIDNTLAAVRTGKLVREDQACKQTKSRTPRRHP